MTSDSIIKTTDYCGNLIYEHGRPKMLLVDGKVGGKTEEFVKDGDWKQFENGIEKARYNGSRYPCADTLFGIHP